jgi:hypothetical protein
MMLDRAGRYRRNLAVDGRVGEGRIPLYSDRWLTDG